VRLLRGEIGKLSGLRPEQYDLPAESLREIQTLHFILVCGLATNSHETSQDYYENP
jgi:hypothetical protein